MRDRWLQLFVNFFFSLFQQQQLNQIHFKDNFLSYFFIHGCPLSVAALSFISFFPLLLQVWAEPWQVSVCALVLQGLPHMWVEAAVMEVVLAEVVLLARGRCAEAGAMGSKMSTWTLSSQRRWRCIWTPQAPPLLEGGEPGNETPPSVVMSSQTHLHTNATGWSDLLPAYVCMCVYGGGGFL